MTAVGTADLVAAVANAGALGFLVLIPAAADSARIPIFGNAC